MSFWSILLCGTTVLSLGVFTAMAREFTDKTGRFSVDADLVGIEGSTILLEKSSGKTIQVQLHGLSERDRDYVNGVREIATKVYLKSHLPEGLPFSEGASTKSKRDVIRAGSAIWSCHLETVEATGDNVPNHVPLDEALIERIFRLAAQVKSVTRENQQSLSFAEACCIAVTSCRCFYLQLVAQYGDRAASRPRNIRALLSHITETTSRLHVKAREMSLPTSLIEASDILFVIWKCRLAAVVAQDGDLDQLRIHDEMLNQFLISTKRAWEIGQRLEFAITPIQASEIASIAYNCQLIVATLQNDDLDDVTIDDSLLNQIVNAAHLLVTRYKPKGRSVWLKEAGEIITKQVQDVVMRSALRGDNIGSEELMKGLLAGVEAMVGRASDHQEGR